MADLSFSSTPILGDLFDTANEAIARSKELGCSGYRTYVINGATKYVPCATYIEYERVLRYYIQQGKLAAFGSDVFGDKLVGLQFANAKSEVEGGDPFFTLGNFSISKSVIGKNTNNILITQPDPTARYTTESIQTSANLNTSQLIEYINGKVQKSLTATLLYDKTKLENYVLFSSLKERMKNCIIEITKGYPGGIKASPISILNPSIVNIVNYPEDKCKFKVNISNLFNPFDINFTSSAENLEDDPTLSPLRNFAKTYTDYVIYYNGIEYPILSVTLPQTIQDVTTGLVITTSGKPFLDKLNLAGEANVLFYIKPKKEKYSEFNDSLSELSKFLLNYDTEIKGYKSEFVTPIFDDNGNVTMTKQALFFPVLDEVNINLFDSTFDNFLTQLNTITDDYDSYKTNLISRFLTTDSLKEFDTEDKKAGIILDLYGRYFDEVKKYVDGLSYMTNLSYDKIENIPDVLVKNFAHTLGLETYEIEDQETIIQSLFNFKDVKVSDNITPAELDIELWRRIAINAFYLFKNKGTRKSIDFILKLVGVPDYIIEINEYVYLASNPINTIDKLNKIYKTSNVIDPVALLGVYPFDEKGYPTIPSNVIYQENGGYLTENNNNIGPYDFGKRYIDAFKNFNGVRGFDLYRVMDNQKSWVYDTEPHYRENGSDSRPTYYYEKDSRLVINTKDLEVYISSDKIIDHTVYKYFASNNIDIDTNLDSNYTTTIKPNSITFNQFMRDVISNYIGVESRKTIITYPTLTKIYYDFLRLSNDYVSDSKALEFLGLFDTYWVKLIKQFTPATAIINAGKKIKNNSFLENKYVYKHGLNNDVSWLGTEGSEYQTTAKKPTYQGQTNGATNVGVNKQSVQGNPITFEISGKPGNKASGIDPTINEYFGVHYSNAEFCYKDYSLNTWVVDTDYTVTGYSGNIISPTGATEPTSLLYNNSDHTKLRRFGVFVIYENELYRLNTVAALTTMQDGVTAGFSPTFFSTVADIKPLTDIVISGSTYMQHPVDAGFIYEHVSTGAIDLTYSGTALYTYIPRYADSKTITFPDCDGVNNPLPNNIEREYIMKSIGMGFAYIDLGIRFDCPPPPPHVCFYDFSGRTIDLSTFDSSTSSVYPTISSYIDEDGTTRIIRQPRYYGFSKNISSTEPDNYVFGSNGAWAVPYKKRKLWTTGVTYYSGDVVEFLSTPSVTYLITGATVTGTTAIPTGATISTDLQGDMFENYSGRTKTDPLMHVDPAYITTINLDPTKNFYSINLSKVFNLKYVFSGSTPSTTYVADDTILNNNLYISDSFTFNFDGFYPVNEANVGPFYVPKDSEALIQTLDETLELIPNKANYVSIQSLNTNFSADSTSVALKVSNPGYYLVKANSYLKFEMILFFESTLTAPQTIKVRLVDGAGFVFNEQEFTFSGNDNPEDRMFNYQYESSFSANQKVYLVVEPIDNGCTLSRYETIDYVYNEPERDAYAPTEDGRFRVFFNTGRRVEHGTDIEYGLSIAPLVGKYDAVIGTSVDDSIVSVDNYILSNNLPETQHYFTNLSRLTYNQSTDPALIFNKLYADYYKKFINEPTLTDTERAVYDKDIKYDKVSFDFNIITKKPPYGTTPGVGIYGEPVTVNVIGSEYYLGNVPEFYERGSVTNNIIIGKRVGRRNISVNNTMYYAASKSSKNAQIISTGNTMNPQLFQAYNSGILDYTKLNFAEPQNIYSNRRKVISGVTYELENEVYTNELYLQILDSVEYFNPNIINYNINDMVKFTISNYKKVVVGSDGSYSIQTVNIDRVYVCVEDITPQHCYRVSGTTEVPYQINDVYLPNGSRSCFEEITRYDPKNFSPWGYERIFHYKINQTNIFPYTNKTFVKYNETGTTLNLSFGDLITYKNDVFRFIYNKPIPYFTGTTIGSQNNRYWGLNDIVLRTDSSNNSYFYKNLRVTYSSAPNHYRKDPLTNSSPLETNLLWTRLSTGATVDGATVDTVDTAANIFDFIHTSSPHTSIVRNSNVAVRLPNLIPSNSVGERLGWEILGTTLVRPGASVGSPFYFSGTTASAFSTYIDAYSVDGVTNVLGYYRTYTPRVLSFLDPVYSPTGGTKQYLMNGGTVGTTHWGSVTNDLITGYTTGGVANKYYYGINRYMATSSYSVVNFYTTFNYGMFLSDHFDNNYSPIFEWLCYGGNVNCPRDFSLERTYDQNSLYQIYKYAVSRGVLYGYISNVASVQTLLPFQNPTGWTKSDFCLVEKFNFKKDRTKVAVYESDNYALTDEVKNDLYFFKNNLLLKPGFTSKDFSGTTIGGVVNSSIDGKLKSGLDKYYDVKDDTLGDVNQYGSVAYRLSGNNIILDYYYDKDFVGFPKTGEFIGKLNISDPCGHSASIIFGILFNTDMSKIDLISPAYYANTTQTAVLNASTYNVRLVVNQYGASTVDVNWSTNTGELNGNKTVNSNSVFDTTLSIQPNATLTITYTYDTTNNHTTYDTAYLDTTLLYDTINNGISNTFVTSTVSRVGSIETRKVVLSNITQNRLVNFSVKGATGINTNQYQIRNVINVSAENNTQ